VRAALEFGCGAVVMCNILGEGWDLQATMCPVFTTHTRTHSDSDDIATRHNCSESRISRHNRKVLPNVVLVRIWNNSISARKWC